MENHSDPFAKKRPLPILTSANYESWFELGKLYLQQEDIEFVLDVTQEEYSLVGDFQKLKIATPTTSNDGNLGTPQFKEPASSFEYQQTGSRYVNEDRLKQWKKADAKVKYNITICTDGYDSEGIRGMKTSKEMWNFLHDKYYDTRTSLAAKYLADLTAYKVPEGVKVEDAWSQLKKLRDRVTMSNKGLGEAFNEENMFQMLLRALPTSYTTIRDAMATYTGGIPARMRLLKDKEDTILEEAALIAKPTRRYKPRRNNSASSSASERVTYHTKKCHICDRHHIVLNCPWLEGCRQYVKRTITKNGEKESRRNSNDQPDKKRKYKKEDHGKDRKRKIKAYNAEDEISCSDESDFSDNGSDIDDVAAISKEQACKIPASTWVADTGASTHMTDQSQLFRGPLSQIKRRTIQVGGGRLYADHMGTVELRVPGGESTLLKKALLVPNLGVNLLSGKRLCESGLKGSWDTKALYLHDDTGLEVFKAIRKGGVYIVNKIAKGFTERAFKATTHVIAMPAAINDSFIDKDQETAEPSETNLDAVDDERREQRDTKTENKKARYELWHRRFAHMGPGKIGHLHEVTTIKKPIKIPTVRSICRICKQTKMRNKTVKRVTIRKRNPLDLISVDIAGPFPVSLRRNKYFLEIIDNKTRHVWCIPLKTKDECIKRLEEWRLSTTLKYGYELRAMRCDNAKELRKILEEWGRSIGIEPQFTEVYRSSQNGVAERGIQTTESNVRAMIKDAHLPLEFWDEAAEAEAYIRNRAPAAPEINDNTDEQLKKRTSICSEEAFTGEKPSIDHIRVWGSVCYSYINPASLPAGTRHDKLMDRGRIGVFVGYVESTTKQLKMYAPDLKRVVRTSVIDVDETKPGGDITLNLPITGTILASQGTPNELSIRNSPGRPRKDGSPAMAKLLTPAEPTPKRSVERSKRSVGRPRKVVVQETVQEETSKEDKHNMSLSEAIEPERSISDIDVNEQHNDPDILLDKNTHIEITEDRHDNLLTNADQEAIQSNVSIPIISTKRQREDDDEDPQEDDSKRIRAFIAELMAPYTEGSIEVALSTNAAEGTSHINIIPPPQDQIPIPKTYRQAINDPVHGDQWREAIRREIEELESNETWIHQTPPKSANLVTTKWVFTIKYTPEGNVERYKARLVARGFSQVEGIDYNETFAPTVRMDSLRMLLAIVAKKDLECHSVDIKNAFVNSDLEEKIYLSSPDGVDVPQGKALLVLRSLYGLKQSGRNWHRLCRGKLVGLGFTQSQGDPCMFVHPTRRIILLLHVDDMLVTAPTKSAVHWFKTKLANLFKIKDLGEIRKILGMRITRNRKERTLFIDQAQYIEEVLSKCGVAKPKHKPVSIPISGYEHIRSATDKDKRADKQEYQQRVGALMWAAIHTRPDIAWALGALSRFLSDPAEHHAQALKTLLRYLRSNTDMGIMYGGKERVKPEDQTLKIYSDADWASDKETRKSTGAGVCTFYGGPIFWTSKRQRSVATSSTESEYMAMAAMSKQSQWIAQVLRDMGHGNVIGDNPYCVDIIGDNQGALALVKNPHLHERSKHIDICYHYIRDLHATGKVQVSYIPTSEMKADGLTKPLPRPKFQEFTRMIGMAGTSANNKSSPEDSGS